MRSWTLAALAAITIALTAYGAPAFEEEAAAPKNEIAAKTPEIGSLQAGIEQTAKKIGECASSVLHAICGNAVSKDVKAQNPEPTSTLTSFEWFKEWPQTLEITDTATSASPKTIRLSKDLKSLFNIWSVPDSSWAVPWESSIQNGKERNTKTGEGSLAASQSAATTTKEKAN